MYNHHPKKKQKGRKNLATKAKSKKRQCHHPHLPQIQLTKLLILIPIAMKKPVITYLHKLTRCQVIRFCGSKTSQYNKLFKASDKRNYSIYPSTAYVVQELLGSKLKVEATVLASQLAHDNE